MLLKFGKVLVMKTLYRKTGRRWIDVIYYRKGKCTEKPMSLKQKHPDKPTRTTHTHTFAHFRSHILNRSAKCLAFLFRFCEKVKPMMGENLALKRFHLVPVLRKRIHLTSSPWSDIYIRCVLCLWNSCSRLTQLIILMLFGFFVLAIFFFLGEFQFKPFDGSFSWGVCVCVLMIERNEWLRNTKFLLATPNTCIQNEYIGLEVFDCVCDIAKSVTIKYYGWHVSAQPQPLNQLIPMLLESINVSVIA